MTLLEVIVALTVAGAALAAGAGVLGFLTDQQDRNGTQAMASANAIRGTLREWISGAQLTTQGDAPFRGVSSTRLMTSRDTHAGDELTFVTSAPTDVASSGTVVHLRMARQDEALKGLVAELTPWRTGGSPTVVGVAPDAAGLQIRYLGSVYGGRAWEKDWVTTSVLPAGARLEIQFPATPDANDRAANALLGIPMTIALGVRR
ncbi:MAG: hypothetical protein JWM95_452 [Gemmatimonadetes bacterium]|nr:hypothetical protein [Gemmatimonadota bacterium]